MNTREQYAYLKPQPVVWVSIFTSACVHLLLIVAFVAGGMYKEKLKPVKQNVMITRLLKKGREKKKYHLPHKDISRVTRRVPPRAPTLKPTKDASKPVSKPRPGKKSPSPQDYTKDMFLALEKLGKKTAYDQDGYAHGVANGTGLVMQEGNEYLTKIYRAVKSKYEVPELISEKDRLFLKATVIIKLDKRGNIKELTFETRSGNDLFDSAVERAIRRVTPFPPPPTDLAQRYAKDGIGIPFSASKMQ